MHGGVVLLGLVALARGAANGTDATGDQFLAAQVFEFLGLLRWPAQLKSVATCC